MIIYRSDCTEPYLNMATEEYLLSSAGDEDIFMLWRNEPAVIIGQNQNAYAEIDREFAERRGIKVVRRLTGGGAVFHDLGNLNYTFISSDVEGGSLNFARFCTPIIDAISALGLNASLSGRNDITVGGAKISGTAQCVRNGHVMHHGTLLWDADLSGMSGVLRPNPAKLSSKGIKSVRSRVCNLSQLYREATAEGRVPGDRPRIDSVTDLRDYLESCIGGTVRRFTPEQTCEIERLAREKYSTWEWNYGRSKEYKTEREKYFPFGLVTVRMTLDRGKIDAISVGGDFFGVKPISELEARLCGVKYLREEICDALSDIGNYISGAVADDIADLIMN